MYCIVSSRISTEQQLLSSGPVLQDTTLIFVVYLPLFEISFYRILDESLIVMTTVHDILRFVHEVNILLFKTISLILFIKNIALNLLNDYVLILELENFRHVLFSFKSFINTEASFCKQYIVHDQFLSRNICKST